MPYQILFQPTAHSLAYMENVLYRKYVCATVDMSDQHVKRVPTTYNIFVHDPNYFSLKLIVNHLAAMGCVPLREIALVKAGTQVIHVMKVGVVLLKCYPYINHLGKFWLRLKL